MGPIAEQTLYHARGGGTTRVVRFKTGPRPGRHPTGIATACENLAPRNRLPRGAAEMQSR
jgi:hypothetical protein